MNFKEMKETMQQMMSDNYETFIKALISVEKNVNHYEALDTLYKQYMDNDGMTLLHEEFDYMIDELKEKGVILDTTRDIKLSEYVGNLVSDIKIEQIEGKNGKFQVANFTLGMHDEDGNSKFVNFSAYGEKTQLVKDCKKGDFVKITGENRITTDVKGKEYLDVKVVSSKLLKARELNKETEKASIMSRLDKLKEQVGSGNKNEHKENKDVSL